MGLIIRVIITISLLYVIINVMLVAGRNPKNTRLLTLFDALDDEESFNKKFDFYVQDMKNKEFLMKGYVIKLWYLVSNKKSDEEIIECINQIDLKPLLKNTGRLKGAELNEDSFYYMNIAIINKLYSDGRNELAQKVTDLNNTVMEQMENRLVYAIGENAIYFYNNEKDKAKMFFEDVHSGRYKQYGYSRQMILMLKNLAYAYLGKIYLLDNEQDLFNELLPDLKEFYKTRMGARFMFELGMKEVMEKAIEGEEY